MNSVVFGILAYLLGSISFAVVVSRAFGLADPRSYGSKNPGATNVLRSGNKLAALLTLLGDGAKGWLAVFLVQTVGADYGADVGADHADIALVAFAVFYGHLYPIFLGFKGGKGVATAAGVLLGLSPWIGLGALLVWLATAAIFRYSSLASLVATATAPLLCALVFGFDIRAMALVWMGVLIFIRHRPNIEKLRAGTESKIGQRKTDQPPAD